MGLLSFFFGSNETRLLEASYGHGDLAEVRRLLDLGTSPNCTNREGRTPLDLAATCGSYEIVELLLSSGADPNIRDKEGRSAVVNLYYGLEGLLRNSADEELIKSVETMIAFLRDHGANIDQPDERGYTVLHTAIHLGWGKFGRLIENGADVNLVISRIDDYSFPRMLIADGADVNAVTHGGFAPLRFAIEFKRNSLLEPLIEAGADIDFGSPPEGRTPLMSAACAGNIEAIVILKKAGADCRLKDHNGWTAERYAKASRRHNICHLLRW